MPRAKGSPWKVELAGQKFGKWTVLHRIVGATWLCKCECGNEGEATTSGLKLGKTKSCGCAGKDWCRTHGMEGTKTYNVWAGMIQRCHNPNAREYKLYGARGIQVCDAWRNSFVEFFNDMGEKPEGLSLDRINNDGNYEPSNCRWATSSQQKRNRRTTVMIEFNGEVKSLPDWAEALDIKRKVLERRIRDGWSIEKAFSKVRHGRWGMTSSSVTRKK